MKIVIIGAVAAGMSAAAKLRRNMKDAEIIVFEKGDEVSIGACGLPFYVSGVVKKSADLIARTADEFRASGIDLREFTEVVSVDTDKKIVTAKNLKTGAIITENYDKLIIGSGAKTRALPPFDKYASNIFAMSSIESTQKIKDMLSSGEAKNVLIVGGGFIGVEAAEACKSFAGVNVIMLQYNAKVLEAFDEEISTEIEEELRKNGVVIHVPAKLESFKYDGDKVVSGKVAMGDGQLVDVPVDMVINATGIIAATDFITNVDKIKNGAIKVDEYMRTNVPDVFAAGDCSVMKSFVTGEYSYAALGTNANKQGRIIADHISGKNTLSLKLLNSLGIKIFDKSAASVGINEKQAKLVGIDYSTNTIEDYDVAGYYGYGEKTMKVKLVYERESKKILGAQMIGKGVVMHRCNYFAIAISKGMTTEEFGMLDLAYTPPYSGVWDVTLVAGNTSK